MTLTLAPAPFMLGKKPLAINNANGVLIGEDGQGALNALVRDRVVVQVKPGIGRLADPDLHPLLDGVRVIRQGKQAGGFFGEDLTNGAGGILWATAVRREALAPCRSLAIEVVQVVEPTGREEAISDVSNRSLYPPFLITARHGHRARLKSIVSGKIKERRIKANGFAPALQDSAFQVVVQTDAR